MSFWFISTFEHCNSHEDKCLVLLADSMMFDIIWFWQYQLWILVDSPTGHCNMRGSSSSQRAPGRVASKLLRVHPEVSVLVMNVALLTLSLQ
mmetsp:Transcript_34034/g.82525  ORF Transcript_34034/g.82525 Transcript_34034/m.82525 type:complete len:92 (+) Transcript_34034:662-937(+)